MNFILWHIETIIRSYSGATPLADFLKSHFKNHPKLGSRDRRAISEAAFIYYRTALFLPSDTNTISVIQIGFEKCNSQNTFLKNILYNAQQERSPQYSIDLEKAQTGSNFSQGITEKEWLLNLLQQPDLFLRFINRQSENLQILQNAKIPFRIIRFNGLPMCDCIAVPNGTKLDKFLPERDYIIQDLSSQTAIRKAVSLRASFQRKSKIWDICAGSGGKSLFWKTFFPNDFLFASDLRKSILHNLKKRFNLYKIHNFETLVLDACLFENLKKVIIDFDFIICDVPCTGSGTWGRTPEQFYFFKKVRLASFQPVQYLIAGNSLRKLRPGGHLIYITCSVFEEENEQVIKRLVDEDGASLVDMQLINGLQNKADSMFVAILRK